MKLNLFTQVFHRVLTVAVLLLVTLFANAQTNVCKNVTTGTEYTDVQEAVNAVAEGQTIQMLTDVDLTKTISVEKTTPAFTLDLNGCVLNAGNIAAPANLGDKASVIYNDGTLTIVDNAPATGHNTWNADHGVATTTVDLTDIKGGVLTGGKGYKYYYEEGEEEIDIFGGAILNFHGTLTISGGTLCKNSADYGGAIDNADGTLTISNCNIIGNTSVYDGGAISNYATLLLNDGTVIKNNTSIESEHSGAVYSFNDATDSYSVNISGKVIITDNTTAGGVISNLCLSGVSLAPVTVSNLKDGTNIGIRTLNNDKEGAYIFTTNGVEEYLNYFSADNADLVTNYQDGQMRLVLPFDENSVTKEKLTAWKGAGDNVQIKRTFIKDGSTYTICLPFSLSEESLATSPLAGFSKLQEFTSAQVVTNADTDNLEITMSAATGIVAGKPYFISWPNEGGSIVNPIFKDVTLTADEPIESNASNGVKFCGSLIPLNLSENDFCISDNGNIEWSYTGDAIEAFHGYFTADFSANPRIKHNMPIVIVEGESTGISNADADVNAVRNGKFIENGKLVIKSDGRKYSTSGQLQK